MYSNKNHNVTCAIAQTLQDHKKFDTAYTNPRCGKILVRFSDPFDGKDHDFLVEISPIDGQREKFEDTARELSYLFSN